MRPSRLSRALTWVCVRSFAWRDEAEDYAGTLRRRGIHATVSVGRAALKVPPASRVMVPILEQRRADSIRDSLRHGD